MAKQSNKPRVGFIGIGMVGKPMSRRVLQAAYPLTVHDIRPDPVNELVKEGATKAETPKQVAEVSDVVLTSLPTLEACEKVYLGDNGLLKGTKPGEILVETSTVPPSLVRKYAEAANKKGVSVIDASLLVARRPGLPGSPEQIAAQGRIMVLVGGSSKEVEKVWPILETFGNPVLHMGQQGAGALTKVLVNAVAHDNFTVACEAFAVGVKAGANIRNLYEVMSQSVGRSGILDVLLEYLESGTARTMRTVVAVKDSKAMLELAREYGVPVLMHTISHSYYEWAQHSGLKDRPWAEMVKLWEEVIGKTIRFD